MPKKSVKKTQVQEKQFSPQIKLKKEQIVLIATIFVFGLLYYFKGLFIVATVNGQPISRIALVQELEKQGGKQTLQPLITKILILQEAKKQNIVIEKNEIDAEIKRIESGLTAQGQTLDQALTSNHLERENLVEQIKVQKIIEKILGKDIKVTDQEINDYIQKNKDFISKDTKPEEIKQNAKQQLMQQKLGEKFQTWIQALQKNAKINYFINY